MHNCIPVTHDIFWIGGNDRRLALFESVYPIPRGVSYNAYLVTDERTVLLDTVDHAVSEVFFENLAHLLAEKPLDFVVVNHMEPDHAATLAELVRLHPEATVVCNAKTLAMIGQFFGADFAAALQTRIVREGDVLDTGSHRFTFVMAPMVHWPEVMVTYEMTEKALFSADAFGTFGALGGNIFADEVPFTTEWESDARRYYTNIVGKYGTQVQALLKKAAGLELSLVCPLHGPIWRRDIGWFIDKYDRWSRYVPEEIAVVIAYASVYGHTANAAEKLAMALGRRGIRDVRVYDASVTHPSVLVAEAFRASHLVFASTTYNAGIFPAMETLLHDIAAHNLQNRVIGFMENGSWAATSGNLMRETLEKCKNLTYLTNGVHLKSGVNGTNAAEIEAMADEIAASVEQAQGAEKPDAPVPPESAIDPAAFHKLSCGMFVLTTREGERDNGCIINTALQVTDTPKRISVTVNRANRTCEMLLTAGVAALSVLTEDAPFAVYERFGYHSGRDTDKFADMPNVFRFANGVRAVPEYANAVFALRVERIEEFETHITFICAVEEAKVLTAVPSATYAYYYANVRPQPKPAADTEVHGWLCKVCGYLYEGDELPDDYICPLCKHGKADFVRV